MNSDKCSFKAFRRPLPLLAVALVTCLIVAGCSGRPSGVLNKEDMAQLLADMHTGESVMENSSRSFPTDSSRKAFLQAIYAKHGVTRAEVDSSFSWYGYHIEKYMEVYDRTVEILDERLDKAQEIAGASADGIAELTVDLQGDSVDVWPGMRWRRFSANMPNDHLTFSIPNDRNWEMGDVYTLRVKAIDNHQPITYVIAAEYSDGRQEYVTSSQSADGWHQIQFALDSARNAQRVFGVISYPARKGETVFIDSITLMRTRWGGHYREVRNASKKFSNRSSKRNLPPDIQPKRQDAEAPAPAKVIDAKPEKATLQLAKPINVRPRR